MEILLERLIHHGELGEIWVAAQGETLQGYLVVVHVLSLEHGGLMGEIDEFFVLPQARAQGVGGRLLASVEAALRERGMVRLQLQLALTNASARRFYETRGYHGRSGYALLDKPLQQPPQQTLAPSHRARGHMTGHSIIAPQQAAGVSFMSVPYQPRRVPALAVFLTLSCLASASLWADIYDDAVAHAGRPDHDLKRDAIDQPAEILRHSGIRPGWVVGDFWPPTVTTASWSVTSSDRAGTSTCSTIPPTTTGARTAGKSASHDCRMSSIARKTSSTSTLSRAHSMRSS